MFVLAFSLLLNGNIYSWAEVDVAELNMNVKMLEHDLNTLKRTVWLDLTQRIEVLERTSSSNSLSLKHTMSDNTTSCEHKEERAEDSIAVESFVRLTKAFAQEKRHQQSTLMNKLLEIRNDMNSAMTDTSVALNSLSQQVMNLRNAATSLLNRLQSLEHNAEEYTARLNQIQNQMDLQQNEQSSIKRSMDNLNARMGAVEARPQTFSCKPSFVSEWTYIKAHDTSKCYAKFEHGLGVLPLKVQVQVRPVTGPNVGWVFQGTVITKYNRMFTFTSFLCFLYLK